MVSALGEAVQVTRNAPCGEVARRELEAGRDPEGLGLRGLGLRGLGFRALGLRV